MRDAIVAYNVQEAMALIGAIIDGEVPETAVNHRLNVAWKFLDNCLAELARGDA
jgi:hypothetical protein